MFYLERVGQGHGIVFLQWCHSIANIKICKKSYNACLHQLSPFQILMFQMFGRKKVGLGHRIQLLQLCPSMANINIYKRLPVHFYASPHRFEDINV